MAAVDLPPTAAPGPTGACVRPYRPGDAEAVHRLGAETAFYGAPVEHILDDRRLFVDVFMRPYTTSCADACWIAEVNGAVAGYLTGCLDTARAAPIFRRALIETAGRALLGRYRIGRRTLRAGFGFILEQMTRRTRPDLRVYPAHLHLNVAAPFRGRGLGRMLLAAFLGQCRAAGVAGVHLTTSDQNTAALHLYAQFGFVVLARARSPYHTITARYPVDGILMGLALP